MLPETLYIPLLIIPTSPVLFMSFILTLAFRHLTVDAANPWSSVKQQFSTPLEASKPYKFSIFWSVGPTFLDNTCNFKVEVGGVSIASGAVGSALTGYQYQEFVQTFTPQSAADSILIGLQCPSVTDNTVDFYFDDISIIETTSGVTTICAETTGNITPGGSGDNTPGGTGITTPAPCGSNLLALPATT
jgi:hypothetical protein